MTVGNGEGQQTQKRREWMAGQARMEATLATALMA